MAGAGLHKRWPCCAASCRGHCGRVWLASFSSRCPASDSDVFEAANAAALEIERRTEAQLVDDLLADGAHAVVGLARTLAALFEGRVHLLVMAETFNTPGARCSSCGRLVTHAHTCPSCGRDTASLDSLREPIVDEARGQGSKLEFVGGTADRRLEQYGGVGAWTRF